jgi:hypothetical protein
VVCGLVANVGDDGVDGTSQSDRNTISGPGRFLIIIVRLYIIIAHTL